MENKEIKQSIPAELDDNAMDNVSGGTDPRTSGGGTGTSVGLLLSYGTSLLDLVDTPPIKEDDPISNLSTSNLSSLSALGTSDSRTSNLKEFGPEVLIPPEIQRKNGI